MDLRQIHLVQATFATVAADADAFSTHFYDHLFSLDPKVRAMFTSDMTKQRQKLVDELVVIVDSLTRLPALIERTGELGRRHATYGVDAHHYDLVLDALVVALTKSLGDAMSDEIAVAWRRAYNLVAETMLHGAAHP